MDGIVVIRANPPDPAKLLGYLNFADGRSDPKFQRGLAELCAVLVEQDGSAALPMRLAEYLHRQLDALQSSGAAAFRDVTQARGVIRAALEALPAAYRAHHADLLAHQSDADLFTPFFLVRSCEAVLRQGPPWEQTERLVQGAMHLLNDYVGYRPIAILEKRPNTEYYPHEKVRPIPLYLQGAGVAPGRYAEVVVRALELLQQTEPVILEEAAFQLEQLEELAVDPRAHDHFHPVNKRPNALFGEWDPHWIDARGLYRRYVLRQVTMDTLCSWVEPSPEQSLPGTPEERRLEAAAVLAGTILMGAGICGAGPQYHDSTVTLSKLVPRVARYRDAFYQHLLRVLPGAHGERLREEARRRQQPFAGVRQYLNQALATQRAAYLQGRRLAQLYAAMGYPQAARQQAAAMAAPAVRFSTEIRIRQTEAAFAAKRREPARAARLLAEVEDLLRRGIHCGVIIDPWNILGFQGLFPIFTSHEDAVRDPRAEELILQIGRQFDLYAEALAAATVAGRAAIRRSLQQQMRQLAEWWDQFATAAVSDLPKVVGADRVASAEHVSRALAAWAQRRNGGDDIGFWRRHREGFTTPAAFAQVVDALIARDEFRAAMALLITWLTEARQVPLEDASASFETLCRRWLQEVSRAQGLPPAQQGALVRRFLELLEANAEDSWLHPEDWPLEEGRSPPTETAVRDSPLLEEDYRDSAEDGREGAVLDEAEPPWDGDFPLETHAEQWEERLRFLHNLARLVRESARPEWWPVAEPAVATALHGWQETMRRLRRQLQSILYRLSELPVPVPRGGTEGMIEYDRRRALKGRLLELVVTGCVETERAARATATLHAELAAEAAPAAADAPWEPHLLFLHRAAARGDRAAVRAGLPPFIAAFRNEPLLYCPLADGGQPQAVLRAYTALQVLEDLLRQLPRLGLVRETFHLTALARQMEWNHIPDGRRVSSFDQLFRIALTGTVDAILAAAQTDALAPTVADILFRVVESYQQLWLQHSQSLRLSILETVAEEEDWLPLRQLIRKYGSDLFTVPFLVLSNMRGILARGVAAWLDDAAERGTDPPLRLVQDWASGRLERPRTVRFLEIILQALIEHYEEYRDYNATTTQSDYGENLYILLDFLRLKGRYERQAWRLRPLAMAHEVLCRRGHETLAARWLEHVAEHTAAIANELLERLQELEQRYGIRLRTIRDRLEERFLMPFEVERAAAWIAPAAAAAAQGATEADPPFQRLAEAIQPLARRVSGVGLDVPQWLRRLEEALRDSQQPGEEPAPPPPPDLDDLQRQLTEWDRPLA